MCTPTLYQFHPDPDSRPPTPTTQASPSPVRTPPAAPLLPPYCPHPPTMPVYPPQARNSCADEHPIAAPSRSAFGPNSLYRFCSSWWLPPSWRAPVLDDLGVPFVSFRDATWPDAASPPLELAQQFWIGDSHPAMTTHQLLARSVAYALSRTAHLVCRHGLPDGDVSERAAASRRATIPRRCGGAAHLTHLRPPRASFKPRGSHPSWWWGEDVAGNGKPGWNTNGSLAASVEHEPNPGGGAHHTARAIAFDVTVGLSRTIKLGYLSSYDTTMGEVNVTVTSPTQFAAEAATSPKGGRPVVDLAVVAAPALPVLDWWVLNAKFPLPFSITTIDSHELPRHLRPGQYTLRISLVARAQNNLSKVSKARQVARFKLLSVQSC